MRAALPALLWIALAVPGHGQDGPPNALVAAVARLTAPLVEDSGALSYRLRAWREDDATPAAWLTLAAAEQTLRVEVGSPWGRAVLWRDAERSVLALPAHGTAFVAEGAVDDADRLAPGGFLGRLLGARAGWAGVGRALVLAAARRAAQDAGALDDTTTLAAATAGDAVVLSSSRRKGFAEGLGRIEVQRLPEPGALAPPALAGLRTRTVERAELERMVVRALRRALQIRVPRLFDLQPPRPRAVPHGRLRHHQGQLLVELWGGPAQIGRAHGELLGGLARRTVDSTLYLVGLVETVRTGRWFPAVLDDAWARLAPHVPARHLRELDAMADAVPGLTRREAYLGNVFPEYFHCSGFAVFGRATRDGVLYHGRVLDYMTLIGLQQSAVTMVMRPAGYRPFLNVGYACFTGVVSGMNDAQLSLGEMGGGGRGAWDGVPMATLMRRALEECSTLAEVEALWQRSPRTCEYYYVWADGKAPDAVGVRAVPEALELVRPGEGHPLLGEGVDDAVVLSSGRRLQELRARLQAGYGDLDEAAALRLMDRPVAMSSNLHNVLFVPQQGVALVAHATDDAPAAEQPYVRYDLNALLAEPRAGSVLASDSLAVRADPDAATQALLAEIGYAPTRFPVAFAPELPPLDPEAGYDAVVRFPTARPSGDARNDEVVLEWYRARGSEAATAPAMLVMHILNGRFRIARGLARFLSHRGVHAFVMHQPYYGRRGTRAQRNDPALAVLRFRQAAADARRAKDAIAALPGVDASLIGIQGVSLGGFVSALAASLDGDPTAGFDRVFLVMAGADLFSMLMEGGQDSARIRRELRRAGLGEQGIRALAEAIDPGRTAHRLDPHRTWLYSAQFDKVVPPRNALALGRAARLQGEHHQWLPAGHYSAAAFLPFVMHRMLDQFRAPVAAR